MLTAHRISKSYDLNSILQDVSFSVNAGERVGLIGPNGCGKSTLMRILIGEERADSGHISLTPASLRLGYLPQGFELQPGLTLDEMLRSASGDPQRIEAELAQIAAQLAEQPDQPWLQERYDQLLAQLEANGYHDSGQVDSTLSIFELSELPLDFPVANLSGGQKTRLSLALVLLSKPQLLLLDEPTNHLDIAMLEWLEDWLSAFRGAALIVSHDRTFLEHTVNRILELNPESQTLRSFAGTYSDYVEQIINERDRHMAAYKDQIAEIRRMRRDIARTKEQARQVEVTTTSRQPGVRRYAKKVAQKAASRQKKLQRYLDSDERLDKPKAGWQLKLELEHPPHSSGDVLRLENLSVGYQANSPLLEKINLHIAAGQRVVLTGPNGCGKTSLLRTINGEIEALSGKVRLGGSAQVGYMSQDPLGDVLEAGSSAVEVIQSVSPLNHTETRSFLHYYLFGGDDPLRPVESLSFGERARLMLARLVAMGCNFLILDEPINHLDIPSRERFEQALAGFQGSILAVVHDRYFIERFATEVWLVEGRGIERPL